MKILLSRRDKVIVVFKPKKIKIKWQNKDFECRGCHCRFKLELSDEQRIFARLIENDGGHIGVNDFLEYIVFCPEGCGAIVEIGGTPFPDEDAYSQLPGRGHVIFDKT